MDLHHDGRLDIDAAEHELKASSTITHDPTRRAVVATLQTAALLDIARSLRMVAADAELGIMSSGLITGPERIDPEEIVERPTTAAEADDRGIAIDDFLIEGDVVSLELEEGEVAVGTVTKLSVSEGDVVAHVDFGDGEPAKVWARTLTRIVGDEKPGPDEKAEVVVDPELVRLNAAADAEGELEDDFTPASALDALRELATDEKPAKKKGGKK
ncbi:hypothetical protein QEH40_gp38 [Microbacterium phage OscarSo]|uniref:Uncharacterized protein n=1 Tax=Microbacterium phage OscarSo TaxID=2985324 RepID=A0A9X9P6C8_9CAUD|nr:hypothetical protein QEH40_gp38 [Microbacterium phage OscarSo]UYL87159.1 hypothetical protein SEA_OSCARSO_38 [Microbacterium phage OscarSo]